mmetsp:Transcript_49397/g.139384  ORF Transcript_49397/g.139384 Transcript_49397/m.139384 type:complete len:209 (-) Transcript_49397:1128-1754(-)
MQGTRRQRVDGVWPRRGAEWESQQRPPDMAAPGRVLQAGPPFLGAEAASHRPGKALLAAVLCCGQRAVLRRRGGDDALQARPEPVELALELGGRAGREPWPRPGLRRHCAAPRSRRAALRAARRPPPERGQAPHRPVDLRARGPLRQLRAAQEVPPRDALRHERRHLEGRGGGHGPSNLDEPRHEWRRHPNHLLHARPPSSSGFRRRK